jgi:hypothetical protein
MAPVAPCLGLRAERTGFEPAVGFDPYTGLANRRFRPLSHLSWDAIGARQADRFWLGQ